MSTVSTDPIADMLTRIRNGIAVRKTEISMPHSKVKEAVGRLLLANRFIEGVEVRDAEVGKVLRLSLSAPNANSKITEIVRISRPGRREYTGSDKIPTVKNGRGLVIVSTSKGLMTGTEAKKLGVGGELICKVY